MHNTYKLGYWVAIFTMVIGCAISGIAGSARAEGFNSYLNPPALGYISGLNGGYGYPSTSLGILRAGTYTGLIYQGTLYSPWIYSTEIVANGVMHEVTVQYSTDNGLTWNIPVQGTSCSNAWIRFIFDVPITFTGTDEVLFSNDWGDMSRGAFLNHANSPKQQFGSDGVTPIQEGVDTDESIVVLQTVATSQYGDPLQVQFEIRSIAEPFTGEPTATSSFVAWGSTVTVTVPVAENTEYHWRVRTINERGEASDWEEFGIPGNSDFKARMRYWIPIGNAHAIGQINTNTTQSGAIFLQSIIGDGSSLNSFQLKGDFSNADIVNQYLNNGVSVRILDPSNPGAAFYISKWTGVFDFSDPTVLKWTRTDGQTVILKNGHTYKIGINFNGYVGILSGTTGNEYTYGSFSWEPTWYQSYGGTCDSEWASYYGTNSCRYSGAMTDLTFLINGPTGYTIGQNSVSAAISFEQFVSDGTTPIAEHATTTDSTVVFKATVDPMGTESATVQIELRRIEEAFTGLNDGGILQSDVVAPGAQIALARTNLTDGAYHWRVRTLDAQGNTSDWQEFGTAGDADFVVDLPLQYKAADLAKLVLYAPYTWGGKGWNPYSHTYVSSQDVFNGYRYDSARTDMIAGLDCSGLVEWAYNRSFNPSLSSIKSAIRFPGANAEYHSNSEITTEDGFKPGDLLFFGTSYNGVTTSTHVAMYTGNFINNNQTYDSIEAASPQSGIIPVKKESLKARSNFLGLSGFRRVAVAPLVGGYVQAGSPINLAVTDPDGFTITSTTSIQTDEEYLREVPGQLYYSQNEIGPDGRPEDLVYWPVQKTGKYIVKATPQDGASATSTYSLTFQMGSTTILLAQDIPLNQIPGQGYGIEASASGTVSTFIPVSIDIKPGSTPNSINLGSNGMVPVAIFGSATFDVHQIDPATIKLANVAAKLKGNGQPMTSYSDVNGDGYMDIIVQVSTQALQLTLDDAKVDLEGQLIGGIKIKGFDSVRIIQ